MRRQSKFWCFLVASALGLTACASGNDASDGSGANGDGGSDSTIDGRLFAYGFGYETGDLIAKSRVDRFRELYPDVTVDFSESGFEEQPFLSSLAGGDPPDVVNLPRDLIGTYIARGVLAPLDECIEQEDVDLGEYYESAVNQVTVDDTPYAIPEFYNTRVWIINNSAFEEAGLDPKTFDFSDWDAIAQANEELTKLDGGTLTRIGIDPRLPEALPLWANSNGSPMISDDGMESLLEDPGVAEALEFTASLHEPAGGRTPFLDFRDTWDFFGAQNEFALDQVAAMPIEQWYLNVLAEASPDVDITVRAPQTRDGEPITWENGNAWAIVAESDNVDSACAFIATMTSTETWIAAAKARAQERAAENLPNTGVYTGNQPADDQIFSEIVDLSELPTFQAAVQTVVENHDNAFGIPPSPAASAYQNAWTKAANAVLNGASAQAELEAADQEAQAAIDAAAR